LRDGENTILAGHGRVAAAKLLKLAEVPCVRVEMMSAEEKRAYVIADNKLAQNAGWDEDLLVKELEALLATDLDFDIGLIGFSIPEIDKLIEGLNPEEPGDPADEVFAEDGPALCAPSDVGGSGGIG
jgi:ParB-like chromosome segregation protein Spo0J